MSKQSKYTTRKYLGDDLYSWTLFRNGHPIMTGMSRQVAKFYKEKHEKEESKQ